MTDDAITEIMQYARDVREGVQNADLYAKWRMLGRLDVLVTIKEGQYYLKCVMGEMESAITKIDKRLKSVIVLGASTGTQYNWRITPAIDLDVIHMAMLQSTLSSPIDCQP